MKFWLGLLISSSPRSIIKIRENFSEVKCNHKYVCDEGGNDGNWGWGKCGR